MPVAWHVNQRLAVRCQKRNFRFPLLSGRDAFISSRGAKVALLLLRVLGCAMEKASILQGVRLTPSDLATLRQLAGPRGGSQLIRDLIRAEAARRALLAGGRGPDKRPALTA